MFLIHVGFEVAMMLAIGGWKVEQLEWEWKFAFLLINHTWSFDIFLFQNKLLSSNDPQMALLVAHVVILFLTKAIGLSLPTIYRLMCSSGRGNVGSPILCILLSQKLVLVKVVTLHIPIIGKWIIKDGGEKMDTTQIRWNVVNKPYIVLLKEYGLEWYSLLFLWIPLRDLETWNYGALPFFLSFFACVQASFFFTR